MQNAIENGQLSEVKRLVSEGVGVDEISNSDWTPAMYATYYGKPDILEYLLLEMKADPNKCQSIGATAVFMACEYNQLECLKILHRAGADPNIACFSGTPPLLKAAENGYMDCVKYMVEHMRADMNQGQKDGATPFFWAAQNNKIEVVRYLLEQGVDADKGKLDSATPSIVAAELGHTEVIRAIVESGRVNSIHDQMYNGVTPLYKACEHGHFDIVKLLCEVGRVDPDLPKNDEVSPLFTACQMGHLNIVKYLAEQQGADINKPKNDGVTPLYMAAEYRNLQIVEYLVKQGADLSLKSVNGLTALHAASIQHMPETIKVLVKGGADVNVQDNGGFPPLSNASEWGRETVVAELLKNGADPSLTGWNGNTGLHIAAWKGYEGVVKKFLGSTFKRGAGVDVNQPNNYGYTPLHLAALGKNAGIVQNLLAKGADVHAQACNGNTPLHCAVEGGDYNCIEYITNASNKHGQYKNVLMMNAADYNISLNAHDPHPTLSRKVALSGAEEVIPAQKFVEVAREVMPTVSLSNVKLVRKRDYLAAGEMPHYDVCEANRWHCTAEDVRLSDKVLFISHRWGSIEHPDPTGDQYNIAVDFLNSPAGQDIEFIWADYSCICQDKSSELFAFHLGNIPTAVWTATHCLVIPQLIASPYNNDPNTVVPTTHLTDYLGRAWCMLEAMAGMLTGVKFYLAFQVGEFISHESFARPEGAASHLGFFMSYVKVWNHLFAIQQKDMMNVDLNVLEEQWRSKEPCAILGLLIRISKSQDPKVMSMLQEALRMNLQLEDLNANVSEINELWDTMGRCSVPEDQMVVLNLMLFIGYYSMNLFQGADKIRESLYGAAPMGGLEAQSEIKQRGELLALFNHFDTDHSGTLDIQEFKEFLYSQGQTSLTDFDMEILLEDVDLNNDGVIDFEEFIQMMVGTGRHAMPTGEFY
mmetsp:Transcript_26025/g.34136  ORF Transcript_26025/g.34136 Transcript_26025/m.34136 type:complete len:927 (+) Transcript_26025:99-2879(+)